jgi:hypothetical protein
LSPLNHLFHCFLFQNNYKRGSCLTITQVKKQTLTRGSERAEIPLNVTSICIPLVSNGIQCLYICFLVNWISLFFFSCENPTLDLVHARQASATKLHPQPWISFVLAGWYVLYLRPLWLTEILSII